MTSTGVLIVLGLLALLGVWIVKDKTFDGMGPFIIGNAILVVLVVGTGLYYLVAWLAR